MLYGLVKNKVLHKSDHNLQGSWTQITRNIKQ